MLSHYLKNRIVAGILIGLVITAITSIGLTTGIFENLNNRFTDSLYTRDQVSKKIIIIGIDDKSSQLPPAGLGSYKNWSRENFSNLLKILQDKSPKVITFDLLFHTRTENTPREKMQEFSSSIQNLQSNKELLEAYKMFVEEYSSKFSNPIDIEFAGILLKFNNIVLAATSLDNNRYLTAPINTFSKNARLGIINTEADMDGTLRKATPQIKIETEEQTYDDIALATVKQYLGRETIDLPIDENGKMLVNFFGDPFSYEMISFVDVLNKKFPPNYFKDKIVLIGPTSSKEVHDEVLTPRSNTTPMPGIEFRANEIQTILDQKFLTEQGKISQIITNALIAIGLTIALNFLGILSAIGMTALAIILYILAAHGMYRSGKIINMVYPFIVIVLTYLSSWVYKYFIADKKKREIRSAFGHYVSEKLVDEIGKNPDMVKLGGEKKAVTVFFSDIKGSTTISEKVEIEAWVGQINEYFTEMETVVKAMNGTLDKYEGDAIMAFWNAPITQENHAELAYKAAIEMRKSLNELHTKWQSEGKPLIEIRIGINTGEALVGNFGSATRFDYTVMGDTVNTASRLESSANKTYGTKTIVAGFTQADITTKFTLRELDTVLLPGKNEAVKLYELICEKTQETEAIKTLLANYSKGLAAYRTKDFAGAIATFTTIANDAPSAVMLERCKKLQAGENTDIDENMVFRILNK